MDFDADIAIVGAGAAGLAAAIFAAETASGRARVVLLDGASSIGKKILISGGGRCNVTHEVVRPEDFNGPRVFVRNVLAAFDEKATVRWMRSLGVELKREDTGKLFPVSDRAADVLNALLRRCAETGMQVRASSRVATVHPTERGFLVTCGGGGLSARRVVLATGGRSLPRTGSDGGGWEIARQVGHTVTETFPALVPLVLTRESFHAGLSGISHDVELSTFAAGKRIDRRSGSLLWTHFGVSGPVVLDASRHWIVARAQHGTAELRCNFLPATTRDELDRNLVELARTHGRRTLLRWLAASMPERVAAALIDRARLDGAARIADLSRERRRGLASVLTELVLPVERDRGWDFAEVTAGGVPLDEVDFRNMQSRRVPGLYVIGEMLDCDGRIGGFNFQWAWSTGFLAGRHAASS